MKHNPLYFLLLLLSLLSACSNDYDDSKTPDFKPDNKINLVFDISIVNLDDTENFKFRSTTTSDFKTVFEVGDQIGIYAVSHKMGISSPIQSSGNAINNVKLTYQNDGSWTSETDLYFKDEQMDFYAYYPYDALAINPLNISFKVNADQSIAENYNKSDLLTADPIKNIHKNSNFIKINFVHRFALVQLEVDTKKSKDSKDLLKYPEILLRECRSGGSLNLSNDQFTMKEDSIMIIKMLRVETNISNEDGHYVYRALVPPQTVEENASIFTIIQNDSLYQIRELSSPIELKRGIVKLYRVSLPKLSE